MEKKSYKLFIKDNITGKIICDTDTDGIICTYNEGENETGSLIAVKLTGADLTCLVGHLEKAINKLKKDEPHLVKALEMFHEVEKEKDDNKSKSKEDELVDVFRKLLKSLKGTTH